MADKKIEDLPLLSQQDLDTSTDFVIVQKPQGGTYRIPIGQAIGSTGQGGYADSEFIESIYWQDSSNTIEFNANNLLSTNSAWKLDFLFQLVETKGSSSGKQGLSLGGNSTGIVVSNLNRREIKADTIHKRAGENKIYWNNSSYNIFFNQGERVGPTICPFRNSWHDSSTGRGDGALFLFPLSFITPNKDTMRIKVSHTAIMESSGSTLSYPNDWAKYVMYSSSKMTASIFGSLRD